MPTPAPHEWELAWHAHLGLAVLLMSVNNFTEQQHYPTGPLCDFDQQDKHKTTLEAGLDTDKT